MILDSTVKVSESDVAGKLRQAFQITALQGQWLVLAENDPVVLRRLNEILGDEAVVHSIDWREPERWLDAVRAELRDRCRTSSGAQLVLVGSSRTNTEGTDGSSEGAAETTLAEVEGGEFERWVTGACQMQQRLQNAKRRFAAAVQILVEKMQGEVGPTVLEGSLQTLFYHAEAGMFFEYDWRQWQFRPVN